MSRAFATGPSRANALPAAIACVITAAVCNLACESKRKKRIPPPLAEPIMTHEGARAGAEVVPGEDEFKRPVDRRCSLCINGLWRFMPAVGPAAKAPLARETGAWGRIWVPGSWQEVGGGIGGVPGVESPGQGPNWTGYKGGAFPCAWYERKVEIPAEWTDRAILLEITRVSTDAVVFVDGTEAGRVSWPEGEADITKIVTPGSCATVLLLVIATSTHEQTLRFMGAGAGELSKENSDLQSKGLTGDVFLSCRPHGAHVSDVFVRTSTRRRELALEVELRDVPRAGRARFVARIFDEKGDEKGTEEKRFETITSVEKADVQVVKLAWSWPDPRLWDYLQPNLYTLVLEVSGSGLGDVYPQAFGFREFWIAGRNFFLNNTEIRLRPVLGPEQWSDVGGNVRVIDGVIDGLIRTGYNIQELWPFDREGRGHCSFREIWYDRADRKGWPVTGPAAYVGGHIFGPGRDDDVDRTTRPGRKYRWDEPGVKESFERIVAREIRRYRNHPCVLMWASSGNFFGHVQDQNPRLIGRRGWIEDEGWNRRAKAGEEAIAVVKKHDPTRPVFMHRGAYVGDVHAASNYLCLLPLQEREEWLSAWAREGEMPYCAVEFGTPLHVTFNRGRGRDAGPGRDDDVVQTTRQHLEVPTLRGNFGTAVHTEPWMTEFCAIYQGRRAYELERDDYRREIASRFQGGQRYKSWRGNQTLEGAPAFQELQHLFLENTFRSWRTTGITGGMVPLRLRSEGHGWRCRDRHSTVDLGPFVPGTRGTYMPKARKSEMFYLQPEGGWEILPGGEAIVANNGPTLAWIAGPRSAFTAKDHSFFAGQSVEKQVVLINDTRCAQEFSYSWRAEVGGKEIDGGEGKGKIGIAKTLLVPFTVSSPESVGRHKVDGRIVLKARIGECEHEDTFSFRVFTKLSTVGRGTVAVFDPVGKTSGLLRSLGYRIRHWKGRQVPLLLVIGREVMSGGHRLPGDLEGFVERGGRAVIFTQDPEWLRNSLGLRVSRHLTRRVFRIDSDHPALSGLDDTDLRDWAGESTLVQAYPEQDLSHDPPYGWRWGNRGVVATAAVEKPHYGSWRPILECEFDLAYSPLMELDYGKGRLVLCTLDLEEHAPLDPAARTLAAQIVEYAAGSIPWGKVGHIAYLGGEEGADLLDGLGLVYKRASRLRSDAHLTIVGPKVERAKLNDWLLRSHLRGGRNLFFLAREGTEAPLGVTLQEVEAGVAGGTAGSLEVPDWPVCEGLSASDLRWRARAGAWLVKAGAEVGSGGLIGRKRQGLGEAIFCQIDPDRFDADAKTYFRFTRWRQTRALSQMLANMGAKFRVDGRIFRPRRVVRTMLSSRPRETTAFYHPDYREDFELGDEPYRYRRW